MVVSPDVGGVVRARALAKRLDNARWRSSTSAASARRIRSDEHHRRREGPLLHPRSTTSSIRAARCATPRRR
jgi:hypothetical protein